VENLRSKKTKNTLTKGKGRFKEKKVNRKGYRREGEFRRPIPERRRDYFFLRMD